jgi:molecular chaperone GrpE
MSEKVDSVEEVEKPKKKKSAHAEEIENLTKERDEYKDRVLRVTADFDNFRKRNADSVQRARRDGANDVIISMLDVLDNLERAYDQVVDDSDKKGVELILRQMKDVLKSNGVEEIKADGDVVLTGEDIAKAEAQMQQRRL